MKAGDFENGHKKIKRPLMLLSSAFIVWTRRKRIKMPPFSNEKAVWTCENKTKSLVWAKIVCFGFSPKWKRRLFKMHYMGEAKLPCDQNIES